MKKSELISLIENIIRKTLNEEYGDAEHINNVKSFCEQMAKILQSKTLLGKNLSEVKIENNKYFGIVSAKFEFEEIKIGIHIQFQDNRRSNDNGPKWFVEVALIGITPKKGSFAKTLTGHNATPEKAWKMLEDIFNLKYKR